MSTDIEIKDLDKWQNVFGKDGFRKGLDATVTKAFTATGTMVRDEQRRLAPRWRGDVQTAIQHKVERSGGMARVRIGPAVGGAPKHAATLEAGRAPKRSIPPYNAGTRFIAWVLGHGFPPYMARIIARNIFFRGLPSKTNPRTPDPPPVYVMRGWNNKKPEVDKALGNIPVDVVFVMWSELPH